MKNESVTDFHSANSYVDFWYNAESRRLIQDKWKLYKK